MYWLTSSKFIPGWIVETGIEYNPITLWTIPTSLITKKFHLISHKRGVQTIVYLRETTTQSTVLQNIIQMARRAIVIHLYLLFLNSINLFELSDYLLVTLSRRKVRANGMSIFTSFLFSYIRVRVNHNSRDILTGLRLTCNNVFCLLLLGVTWAACVYSHCVNTVKLLTR